MLGIGHHFRSINPGFTDHETDPGAKTGVGGTMPPLGIPGLAGKR
jgi:hypothetical protein